MSFLRVRCTGNIHSSPVFRRPVDDWNHAQQIIDGRNHFLWIVLPRPVSDYTVLIDHVVLRVRCFGVRHPVFVVHEVARVLEPHETHPVYILKLLRGGQGNSDLQYHCVTAVIARIYPGICRCRLQRTDGSPRGSELQIYNSASVIREAVPHAVGSEQREIRGEGTHLWK